MFTTHRGHLEATPTLRNACAGEAARRDTAVALAAADLSASRFACSRSSPALPNSAMRPAPAAQKGGGGGGDVHDRSAAASPGHCAAPSPIPPALLHRVGPLLLPGDVELPRALSQHALRLHLLSSLLADDQALRSETPPPARGGDAAGLTVRGQSVARHVGAASAGELRSVLCAVAAAAAAMGGPPGSPDSALGLLTALSAPASASPGSQPRGPTSGAGTPGPLAEGGAAQSQAHSPTSACSAASAAPPLPCGQAGTQHSAFLDTFAQVRTSTCGAFTPGSGEVEEGTPCALPSLMRSAPPPFRDARRRRSGCAASCACRCRRWRSSLRAPRSTWWRPTPAGRAAQPHRAQMAGQVRSSPPHRPPLPAPTQPPAEPLATPPSPTQPSTSCAPSCAPRAMTSVGPGAQAAQSVRTARGAVCSSAAPGWASPGWLSYRP